MNLTGKTVFIAGGTSGLGLACAQEFSARGAAIVVGARRRELAEQIAAGLPDSLGVELDIADLESIVSAIAQATDRYGSIHANVNTAGVNTDVPIVDHDGKATVRIPELHDAFRAMVSTNLIGTFQMMSVMAAAMWTNEPDENGERGVIVNTSSSAAVEGAAWMTGYAGTKAGIIGYTLPAARDVAGQGIRINTIIAGGFSTPMLGPRGSQEYLSAVSKEIPNPQRIGRPDEFAQLAIHLVENTYMNAESIRIDGGIRLR
ncbi:SDR family NAD(P)-dependent oxidoreductase [Rhodococcus globerulus]|uniref:SDR family NAD(P)-dependent oxidoreductase n=1 Tax=Rhodococcus globerulus TaxID=33008 RepID=A0ABU4C2X1_RHOGO|nr:SDR family NAD(P)-dependent oxidoreductase [Rhodococcus globerulus]MDV6270847.1 SDR family NAD(P)-dependent oxidoreductase [Rhodococcus globerulus]